MRKDLRCAAQRQKFIRGNVTESAVYAECAAYRARWSATPPPADARRSLAIPENITFQTIVRPAALALACGEKAATACANIARSVSKETELTRRA
jgi:hypothetical protein